MPLLLSRQGVCFPPISSAGALKRASASGALAKPFEWLNTDQTNIFAKFIAERQDTNKMQTFHLVV